MLTPPWKYMHLSLIYVLLLTKHIPISSKSYTSPNVLYCPSMKIRKPLFGVCTAPIWCNIYRIILAIVRRFFPKYLAVKPYLYYVQTLNIINKQSFFLEISVQKRNLYYPWVMGWHLNRYYMVPLSDELYTTPDLPYTHYPQAINLSMMIHVSFLMC